MNMYLLESVTLNNNKNGGKRENAGIQLLKFIRVYNR